MAKDTVLVVDDDPGLRDFACEALEDEGYYAVPAPDAGAALRVLGALAIDLVLLDRATGPPPDEDVVRAARRCRRGGARVLLWTGWHDAPALARALGADGALEKPVDLDALLERVRAELGAP